MERAIRTPPHRGALLGLLVIIAATAIAYANAFPPFFGGLDAKESIRDNPYIRTLWPLSHAMSLPLLADTLATDPGSKGGTMVRRPVLSLTFALNQALLGPAPWGYHLVNILLHIGGACVLFALLRHTLALRRIAHGDSIALATALLWAVHPLQTESVTNLVQRAEALMGLLYLTTLYAAARHLHGDGHRWGWAAVAVVACALGMGTKETMVTAPVAVLLYDWVFVSRSLRDLARHGRLHAALWSTWLVLAGLLLFTADDAARDFVAGKTRPYVLAQPRVILHYLRLAFWPDALHVYVNTRAFTFVPGLTPWWVFWAPALLLTAALGTSAWGAYRRYALGFAGVAFFLVLAPTSSFVATSDVLQEHRIYLSLASVIATVVVVADRLVGERRRLGALLLALTTLALIARTHARNADYHTEFGMVYPGDMRQALTIVARHEFGQGHVHHALELFDQAIAELRDDNARAEAHFDLANLFAQRGSLGEAHHHYLRAIGANPALAAAHNNLAVLLAVEGDLAGAAHHLEEAIAYNPRHFWAMITLANVHAVSGREAEAIALYERVLDLIPQLEAPRKALERLAERRSSADPPPLELDTTVRLAPGYGDAFLLLAPRRAVSQP